MLIINFTNFTIEIRNGLVLCKFYKLQAIFGHMIWLLLLVFGAAHGVPDAFDEDLLFWYNKCGQPVFNYSHVEVTQDSAKTQRLQIAFS